MHPAKKKVVEANITTAIAQTETSLAALKASLKTPEPPAGEAHDEVEGDVYMSLQTFQESIQTLNDAVMHRINM